MPSPLDMQRVQRRAVNNLQSGRRSGVRVYPALPVQDGGSKVLPAGPKKPRGPKVTTVADLERQKCRELLQRVKDDKERAMAAATGKLQIFDPIERRRFIYQKGLQHFSPLMSNRSSKRKR